jgi:2-C-methyl-D-erythritol 2,4-cyclodiphosphate synthase
LERTIALLKKEKYTVVNIDTTVCLQAPKIISYVLHMKEVISSITGIAQNDVSVKATTTEHMGFVGREEGLMAYATVLLKKNS